MRDRVRAAWWVPALLVGAGGCRPEGAVAPFLGPPGSARTHVVVTVRQGEAPAGGVWRLRSTVEVDGARSDAVLPDTPPRQPLELPTRYVVVAQDRTGRLSVRVEALGQEGDAVGRALGAVDLVPDTGVALELTLARPCGEDADCQDGVFCNGVEVCASGTCGPGRNPCGSSVPCVQDRCEETLGRCILTARSDLCPAGEYCDAILGCLPGVACEKPEDCAGLGGACNPMTCLEGRCAEGEPVNPDDGNPCTVDLCDPEEGPRHLNLAEGNVCSAPGEPRAICRWGTDGGVLECRPSLCPDGYVDRGAQEQCDLGEEPDLARCTAACQLPRCGDGIVHESLLEECDDGNTDSSDDCVGCRHARCGDGYVHTTGTPPLEGCDDGARNGQGLCSTRCRRTAFRVQVIMGAGAPCPGADGGVGPPADGGWEYSDAGSLVGPQAGSALCTELDEVQDLALRTVGVGDRMVHTDEVLVADRQGLYAVNLRSRGVELLAPSWPSPPLRSCTISSLAWELAPGEGLPGLAEGLDGLVVANRNIYYQTRESRRTFRAALASTPGGRTKMDHFAYVGRAGSSVAECCPAGQQSTWRSSVCIPCPEAPYYGMARATLDIAGRPYLFLPDESRRIFHIINDDNACDGSSGMYSLPFCGHEPPDGGFPLPDAGAGRVPADPRAWRMAAVVPAACLGNNSAAAVITSPGAHVVARGGFNLPFDIANRCMSSFRHVAGVDGRPGNALDGEVATAAPIHTPTGVGQDQACNIFFADTGNGLVRQVTMDGRLHNVAAIPGLRTLVVHPVLGVVAATATTLFHVTTDSPEP